MKMDWREQVVLVTGGTGSFGRRFTKIMLEEFKPKKLIIFSRDELKQMEMRAAYDDRGDSPMRYFIGDVRDRDRLVRAMHGVTIFVHAAALKQVPACEYNPFEAVQTNILGSKSSTRLFCVPIKRSVRQISTVPQSSAPRSFLSMVMPTLVARAVGSQQRVTGTLLVVAAALFHYS